MGKMFSNQGGQDGTATMGSPSPTCGGCRRGRCHGHGYGNCAPAGGEPYSMNQSMGTNRPCMGHCNPAKLYGDTHSYLNNNLMQPVVQEVYNDLKSITPANTVMNNSSANNMGLSQGQASNASNGMGMAQNNELPAGNMGNQMQSSMSMGQTPSPANNMSGMGHQIMKMMMGESAKQGNTHKPYQTGKLTGSMVIDAPQSPHGQVGLTPLNQHSGADQGQFNTSMNLNANINRDQYNAPNMNSFAQNPTTQYMTQPNSFSGANAQNSPVAGQGNVQHLENRQMGNPNADPVPRQMAAPNYGQHTQCMIKFNEMFPGVMKGDLGFDPMAIAIQMNPANQQKAAMDTMQKLMHGIPTNSQEADIQPPAVSFAQPQNTQNAEPPQNSPLTGQQYVNQQNIPPNQNINQQMALRQQQPANANDGAVPQHPVVTETPSPNQQQMYQQPLEPQQQGTESIGVASMPPVSSNQRLEFVNPPQQQMIKEPIFPADTTKNLSSAHFKPQRQYEYNTLGQPIEMLPAHIYHPPEPNLPQTLSPQPISSHLRSDQMRYSNVKSTVSKTSLMGNKPVGKVPSRSQLQHIYNQYKGSHSYTQQNVKPVGASTLSDGRLNVTHSNANPPQHAPVERVAGDTIDNNSTNDNRLTNKVEQVMGQVGEVPAANKPHGDIEPVKPTSAIPARQAKLRNGLQDVVYTSYPTAAAWSFHGSHTSRRIPAGYNFRGML